MTSVQAELSSARLADEPKSSLTTQDSALSEVTSDSIYAEISARIGGRFTADLAAILKSSSAPQTEQQLSVKPDRPESDTYINRQFALDCLRAGKVQFALRLHPTPCARADGLARKSDRLLKTPSPD